MHDIKTIKQMNRLVKLAKSKKVAKALNNIKGHPKDAEKGRRMQDEFSEPWEELSSAGAHNLRLTN